jgi:hypothetical protein
VERSEETVIDLGLLAQTAAETPSGSDPARRARAWWDRRRRGLAGGLAAALVLITTVGSAPQPGDGVVTIALPPTGYGRFDVVGDLLFVAETNTRWRAYELPTGVPGWSLERPDDAPLGLVVSDGLILDRLYGAFGATRDPATGSVLLSPDQLELRAGVPTVHVLTGAETALAAGDYRYYRDASPHPRFARRATGRVAGWLAGDPPVIVRISAGGLVELHAPATGAVLTRRYLPVQGTGIGLAAVFDDLLVLQNERAGALLLQGYELGTLAPLWERTISHSGDQAVWVDQCGPMLCVHRQVAGGGATVVDPLTGWLLAASRTDVTDPATGRTAWVAPAGRTQVHPVGDRFLAYRGDGTLAAVVDAHTGRPLRQLGGWRAMVPAAGGDPGPLILMRTDQTGQTRLARLDVASASLAEVAVLPSQPGPCQSFSQGLVCRHAHQLRVWTL